MSATVIRTCLFATGLSLVLASRTSADVVMLKNGGQVRGKLQTEENAPTLVIRTLLGGTISIDRSSVENVERRSLLIEEYESRAHDVAGTVDARWALAEWCKTNGLREQREEQLQMLLDIEPDHADARRILNHVLHHGTWMTREEWMTSRGYVLHKGKYVTQQELDLVLKSDGERAAETAWYPKIRQWFSWMTGRNPERAAEGRANFAALNDPDAVPALVNFLGDNNDPDVRMFCVELLGQMKGPKPVGPLVRKSLFDDEHSIRIAARNALRQDQYGLALEFYVPELKHESNAVVQRAAVAIRDMGDMTTVPYLIAALVTRHRWKVDAPTSPAASVGMTADGQVGLNGNSSGWLPAEVQGLAATGQLPYGAIVVPSGFEIPQPKRKITIKGDVKNADVLAALKKITGQDFGYNKRAWESWWQTQAKT
jgi:hypothetical protein